MKRTMLRILVAVIAFALGLTLSQLLGAFTPAETPPVAEVKSGAELVLPTPPPVLPVPLELPKLTQILDYDVNRFSPDGSYEISGKLPKGFEDFSYISIFPEEKAPVSVGILKSVENYEYLNADVVFALVTQKRLVLVTAPFENGFEYRFDGQFLRNKILIDYPEGTVVLQGTLTKTRNGKTVAEANVKFHMVWDAC